VNADGTDADEVYYMGVIDILQQYNTRKHMETFFKGLKYDPEEISSVNPHKYARRFVAFLDANSV
jgi:1-phosphatidylinositol-4-phosphate 5-kinase